MLFVEDPVEAERLLLLSAAGDSDPYNNMRDWGNDARFELGTYFLQEESTAEKGCKLLEEAAEREHVSAQTALGMHILRSRPGHPKPALGSSQEKKGIEMLERASKAGDADAQGTLGGYLVRPCGTDNGPSSSTGYFYLPHKHQLNHNHTHNQNSNKTRKKS